MFFQILQAMFGIAFYLPVQKTALHIQSEANYCCVLFQENYFLHLNQDLNFVYQP
jgi:hypothetical protein